MRCVNALEAFDDGRIEVDGRVVDPHHPDLRRLRQDVGMVFQQFNLFPHYTAGRNVMLAPMVVKKLPDVDAERIAREKLAQVGLSEKFDSYPDKLSGGQQQRVAIARALAMDSQGLLCDEITSALDPELVGEVLQVIARLAGDGMTMLIVTHEMRFAREVADRVVFMHEGRVWETGPPDRIFSAPTTPELQQFLRSLLAG